MQESHLPQSSMIYRFHQCRLDTTTYSLSVEGETVPIEPLVFDLLAYLIENRDRVIARDELLETLWQGKVVTDSALAARIKDARKAVGDDGSRQELIRTVHGRGFQFVANVSNTEDHNEQTKENSPIRQVSPTSEKPSVTIKPFVNLDSESSQDYFVTGLMWDIWAALVKIPHLILVEGESQKYDPRKMSLEELGQVFNVQYVIQGGVRKSENQIRVNIELVEVSTGKKIWGDKYDGSLDDLFDIQDTITENITISLNIKLVFGEAARYLRDKIKNPEALDNFYRGERALYGTTTQELLDAQHFMEETIRLEPDSPVGYAMTAYAYWMAAYKGLSSNTEETLKKAVEMSEASLQRSDTSGYPNLILAHYYLYHQDISRALEELEQGMAFRPSCPGANALKAAILIYLGRASEAIEYAEQAVRLQPINPSMFPAIVASAYFGCARYQEAIFAAQDAINIDNKNTDPYLYWAASLVGLGKLEEARGAALSVTKLKPNFTLKTFAHTQPFKDKRDLDHLISNLKIAGLQ